MLEHAFRFASSVVFLIGPRNLRPRRAIEKIGGVQVGSRLDGAGRESLVDQITTAAFVLSRGIRPQRLSRDRTRGPRLPQ